MGISLFSACPSPAFGGQAQLRTASTPFMGIPRRYASVFERRGASFIGCW